MLKVVLAIGIAISAISVTSQADAQQNRKEYRRMNWSENLPATVQKYHGKRVSVVSYSSGTYETGQHPQQGTPKQVQAIRAAARSNPTLMSQLKARKLTADKIEWVWLARNGNMVVYVK
jgi:hypothetical protein